MCVFSFLPKSVETGGFLVFVLGSAGYVGIYRHRFGRLFSHDHETSRLKKLYFCFICLAAFYLLLSCFNPPRLWNVKGLWFNRSYIPRHFIIVAELFLPVLLAEVLFKLKVFNHIKVLPLVLLFLVVFFGVREANVYGVLLISLALISWKCDQKILLLPAFFINRSQTTYVLGFLVLIFMLFFEIF